ncbi:MAG TPA: xanthine dehydrogenase family protein subunit M [Candidatus Rifleibacterium sp.]|nr:xanthine dehydrogenase family protein subunit M [Candidatus Rifleibacterium sp.]HPT45974.1 xanthine dehydrogenase family protein subunit M [Candidatus Rifleibacterium sp.]
MINIKFYKPTSVEEACELLTQPDHLAIAGGTDMIVKLRNGMFPGARALVDLSALPWRCISVEKERMIIGSGCTMSAVATHQAVREFFPALAKAASSVGAAQIRNAATLGGNIANASPAGDTIPALYSLEAAVMLVGPSGRRSIAIDEFFTGPGRTASKPGELIEGFSLPLRKTRGEFIKLGERRAHAISKINMALSVFNDGQVRYRIAIGSVAPTVLRCKTAEELLEKNSGKLTPEILAQAASLACETARPISDIRSSKSYRKQMAGVLLKRALLAVI